MAKPSTSSWQPQTPSASVFLSLPHDALLAVFKYLSEEDLFNIAITNRAGCAEAIAILFKKTSPTAYDYQARWLNILFANNDPEELQPLFTASVYRNNLKARLEDTIPTPIGLKIKIAICFMRFSDERQSYQEYINTAAAQNLDEVIPALYASCGQLHPERLANIQQLLFSIVDGNFDVFHRLTVAKTFAVLAPQLPTEQINKVLLKVLLPLFYSDIKQVIASASQILATLAPRLQLNKTLEQLLKLLEEDKQQEFGAGYESVKITRALVTLNPLISSQQQFEELLKSLAPLLTSPTSALSVSTAKALAALSTAPVTDAFNRVIKALDPLLYGNYGADYKHIAGFMVLQTLIAIAQDEEQLNHILDILQLFTKNPPPEKYLGCFARRHLAQLLEDLTLKVSTAQQTSTLQQALQSLSNDPDGVVIETMNKALKALALNGPNKKKTTPPASTSSLVKTTATLSPQQLDKTKRATINKLLSTAWQDLALNDLPLDKKVLIQTALGFIANLKPKAAKKFREAIDRLDLNQPYKQLEQAILQYLDKKQQPTFLFKLNSERGRVEVQFLSEVSKIVKQEKPTSDAYKQALQNLKLSKNSALFLRNRYQLATTSPQASTSGIHPGQQ